MWNTAVPSRIGKTTGFERFYEIELHGHVGFEESRQNAQGRVFRFSKKPTRSPAKTSC